MTSAFPAALTFVLLAAGASAQNPLLTFSIDGSNHATGHSVASVGDLTGDGIPDLVVGGPFQGAGYQKGVVRVYSGADGAQVYSWEFSNVLDDFTFGYSVAGVGDVNLDGFPDVAAGAPYEAWSAECQDAPFHSSALVFSGRTGLVLYHFDFDCMSELGHSIAAAGDVDADGSPDVIAAGTGAGYLNLKAGAVYSGKTGAILHNLNAYKIESVTGVGDVNGDGYADFAFGTIPDNSVLVRSGKDGSTLAFFGGLGDFVARAADVDGDGIADLAIGNPGDPAFGPNTGAARVFSGAGSHPLLLAFTGITAGDRFGAAIASIGDVDGDGAPDLAIGAPGTGSKPGIAWVYSAASGFAISAISGSSSGAQLGFAVAAAGDLNADGRPDLAVGAPGASGATVYSLFSPGITPYGLGTPGCSGPEVINSDKAPQIGTADFAFICKNAAPLALGLGLVCDAQNAAGSDPFGIGVTLLVDLASAGFTQALNLPADSAGIASATVAIPNNPFLVGLHFYAQGLFRWGAGPCVPSLYGLSTTNGIEIVVLP